MSIGRSIATLTSTTWTLAINKLTGSPMTSWVHTIHKKTCSPIARDITWGIGMLYVMYPAPMGVVAEEKQRQQREHREAFHQKVKTE